MSVGIFVICFSLDELSFFAGRIGIEDDCPLGFSANDDDFGVVEGVVICPSFFEGFSSVSPLVKLLFFLDPRQAKQPDSPLH